MNYETLENEIRDRLQPFTTVGIDVVVLPETEAERKRPHQTNARFTVIYSGSEYDLTMSTSSSNNNEKIFVTVLVESSFLRGAKGVYSLVSIIKKALSGFKPTGCQKLQPLKHHTIGQPEAENKDNMWNYQVVFQTTTLSVEDFTESLTPLLEKLTFKEPGETFTVPPTE